MKFTSGTLQTGRAELSELPALCGKTVSVHGAVHAIRDMGGVTFLMLRKKDGVLQCVFSPEVELPCDESAVVVTGLVRAEPRAPGGYELSAQSIEVLSIPAEAMPVPVSKWKLKLNLDTELGLRPVVLRNLRERSIFKIQEGIVRGFRDYLHNEGFTEIHTPKIVHARRGGRVQHLQTGLLRPQGVPRPVPADLQADHGWGV